jgi:type II secretory pathway component GspD/PulD (secretin)
MTLAAALLLPALSPHCLRAQSTPDAASSHPRITKVFYLADTNPQDEPQLMYAVRNGIAQDIHVELDTARGALVVTGTADQVELAQRIISELDRPSKSYRLTYTITDFENGKRIGTQHFSFVVAPGKRTTLKEGDKVPIATGSFSSGNATSQTQFTYLDVGMNFDATLDESSDGFHLKTKVEESSIGPSTNIAGVSEPVVRQTVLESETTLVLSKPLILGTLDIPLTTRHSEVTVVVEPVS